MVARIASAHAAETPKMSSKISASGSLAAEEGRVGRVSRAPASVARRLVSTLVKLERVMTAQSTTAQSTKSAQAKQQEVLDSVANDKIKAPTTEELRAMQKVADQRADLINSQNRLFDKAAEKISERAS